MIEGWELTLCETHASPMEAGQEVATKGSGWPCLTAAAGEPNSGCGFYFYLPAGGSLINQKVKGHSRGEEHRTGKWSKKQGRPEGVLYTLAFYGAQSRPSTTGTPLNLNACRRMHSLVSWGLPI